MEQASKTQLAGEAWLTMSDLVLDRLRRRAVTDVTGLSFGKARALRRLARHPMSMGELAEAMDTEKPNATTIVDELESLGLVERRPHPTDRRAKLVEVTPAGSDLARRADEILSTPPPGLTALTAKDLATLKRILERVTSSGRGPRVE
jgi:DNA-binding MarR family transcriptional regulator